MALSSRKSSSAWLVLSMVLMAFIAMTFFISSSQLITYSRRQLDKTSTNDGHEMAIEESFGFLDDIDNTQWLRMQHKARTERIFQNVQNPDQGIENAAQWMMDNVDPIFTCPNDRRIGGRGDGPKWVCDPHRLTSHDDCLVYSVGSEGNYMFEDGLYELLGKHCEIHVFDPNPKYARLHDPETKNIHFHPWGMTSASVGSTMFGTEHYYSFQRIREQLGHVDRRIDIFKIDCEGCEWTSYQDWIADTVDIRQILIETHPSIALQYGISFSQFMVDLLQRGFVPFSKEANTNPGALPYGTLFEWGFVRLTPSFLQYSSPTSTSTTAV